MRIDILLVEGGRNKNSKGGLAIKSVLSPDLNVMQVWLDEHGWWWLIDGENNRRIAIIANRIVEIDQTELVIGGGWEMGLGINKVWPLDACFKMSGMGVKASLELAGVELIGTGSIMTWLCHENSMSKLVFVDVPFDDKKSREISVNEWQKDFLQIEESIGGEYKFPLVVEYNGKQEKISIFENFANMVFKIFEEGVTKISIWETGGLLDKYMISFIGRKNFLPSKLCKVDLDGKVELADDKNLERELQNFIIGFVGKYDVKDYGLFHIYNYVDGWRISNIDLMPDLSLDGKMASIWRNSGFNYANMINKIRLDSLVSK